MPQDREMPLEETLNPEDWIAIRELGHRRVDDMLKTREAVRQAPPWQPPLTRRFEPDSRREEIDVLVREVNQIGEGV